jgi:hypothetical protein
VTLVGSALALIRFKPDLSIAPRRTFTSPSKMTASKLSWPNVVARLEVDAVREVIEPMDLGPGRGELIAMVWTPPSRRVESRT